MRKVPVLLAVLMGGRPRGGAAGRVGAAPAGAARSTWSGRPSPACPPVPTWPGSSISPFRPRWPVPGSSPAGPMAAPRGGWSWRSSAAWRPSSVRPTRRRCWTWPATGRRRARSTTSPTLPTTGSTCSPAVPTGPCCRRSRPRVPAFYAGAGMPGGRTAAGGRGGRRPRLCHRGRPGRLRRDRAALRQRLRPRPGGRAPGVPGRAAAAAGDAPCRHLPCSTRPSTSRDPEPRGMAADRPGLRAGQLCRRGGLPGPHRLSRLPADRGAGRRRGDGRVPATIAGPRPTTSSSSTRRPPRPGATPRAAGTGGAIPDRPYPTRDGVQVAAVHRMLLALAGRDDGARPGCMRHDDWYWNHWPRAAPSPAPGACAPLAPVPRSASGSARPR